MAEGNPYTYYRASTSAKQRNKARILRDGSVAENYLRDSTPFNQRANGPLPFDVSAPRPLPTGMGIGGDIDWSRQGMVGQRTGGPETIGGLPGVQAAYSLDTAGGLPAIQDQYTLEMFDSQLAQQSALPTRTFTPANERPDRRTQEFKRQQQAAYTGALMDARIQDPREQFDNYVDDLFATMQQMIDARDQALAEGRGDIAQQYDAEIRKLQGQIADAQQGRDEGNAAFQKYRETVDPLFDEHLTGAEASKAAEERINARTDETLAATNEAQAEATSAFDDMLVKIGADNIELASELHAEAASLDELGESFIVGAGDDAAEIAALHGALVDKTVASLRSDDEFFTEKARIQLEDQFNNRIDALKERQAEVRAAKSQALDKFTRDFNKSWGDLPFGNPDEAWGFMAGKWAEEQGWDYQHTLDVQNEVEAMWGGGIRTASDYRKAVTDLLAAENAEAFAIENNLITADGKLDIGRVEFMASEDPQLMRILRGEAASYDAPYQDFSISSLERYDSTNRDAAGLLDMRSLFVDRYADLSREIDAFGEFEINPSNGWVSPVGPIGEYSNSFGYKKPESKGGHIHKGVDIYAPQGSYIYAPEDGQVIAVGVGDISGYHIKVRSDTGIVYYIAHMAGMSHLKKGDRVRAGASIGNVGNSGNARGTKPHAHFEMRKGDEWINPYTWLNAARDGGGTVSTQTYSYGSTSSTSSTSSSTQRPGLT